MPNDPKIFVTIGQKIKGKYGVYEIISVKDRQVKLRFIKTGYITWYNIHAALAGKAKDYMLPKVHGVGFLGAIGEGTYQRRTHNRLYVQWQHMLGRCYRAKSKIERPDYIGRKCVKRWHNFQLFCADIVKMPNHDVPGFSLDKDLRVLGNKTYSPKFCSFVPDYVNSILGNKSKTSIYGNRVSKSGKLYFVGNKSFTTIKEAQIFAKIKKQNKLKLVAKKYKTSIHPDVYNTLMNY